MFENRQGLMKMLKKSLNFTNWFLKLHMKIANLQHQILGCELHQNVLGGQRPPPGPSGGAVALSQSP